MIRLASRLSSIAASGRRSFVGFGSAVGTAIALLRGRWRLWRRDVDAAVAALDVATRRAPESFGAWLHFARAQLRSRNWVGARRALARARDLSPERFERVAIRTLKRDGFEIAVLFDPAPVAAVPAGDHPIGTSSAGRGAPGGGPTATRAERASVRARTRGSSTSHPLGDCRDLDEYARFRSMPPITPAEIESVDWDAVADDLLD